MKQNPNCSKLKSQRSVRWEILFMTGWNFMYGSKCFFKIDNAAVTFIFHDYSFNSLVGRMESQLIKLYFG